ncbi:hypothetical protein ElyMa_001720800 [Elysia marginata]|uniref:Secreted protein n=1 Tax=Elysia marginata TaxID=1093978 RepID=A0AAV4JYC9_9GAST|nr:hypothetical protein ElyMa_001720800 [Elysia marginata]
MLTMMMLIAVSTVTVALTMSVTSPTRLHTGQTQTNDDHEGKAWDGQGAHLGNGDGRGVSQLLASVFLDHVTLEMGH